MMLLNKKLLLPSLSLMLFTGCALDFHSKNENITIKNTKSDNTYEVSCTYAKNTFYRTIKSFKCNPKSIINLYCTKDEDKVISHIFSISHITLKDNAKWAKTMHMLLTKMNIAVNKAKNKGKDKLTKQQIEKFTKYYEKIISSAYLYYPPPDKTTKTKGRQKQEKGKNLLDRLSKYKIEHLRFLNDFKVPFTNNLAERDLRMIKVKEKISGTFASFKGGEIFCRIRSYISTLKKNNIAVLQGLRDAFNEKAFVFVE